MPRPFDWHLVGLAGDPTPGDAFGIRSLAREYGRIAEAAADAEDIVRRARRSHGSSSWIGLAGDVFREKSEGLPGELASAAESYAAAEQALKTWADRLDDAQAQADRGLQQAREAHGELAAARAAIGSASWSLTAAQAQVLQYETLERLEATIGLPPGVSAPTPYQVRSADRAVQQAQQSLQSAQAAESAAQSRLDAARALVLEAKTARDEAESTTVQAIATAGDSAVKPSSIWEAITSSQAWQVTVTIATVVVTVVGIIAIFIGGPIVWVLLLAATALLIANALLQIAQGKDAWAELALLVVSVLPFGALLGTGARLVLLSLRTVRLVMRPLGNAARLTRLPVSAVKPGLVRFSQSSVSYRKWERITREPYTYDDLVRSMKAEGWRGDPIDLVRMPDGVLTTIDNTRLVAALEAGIDVRAVIHAFDEPLSNVVQMQRFDLGQTRLPTSWGEFALHRIGGQRGDWPLHNPFGSFDLPTITGRP